MGKGDKKTRRGKIFAASYGNSRRPATNKPKKLVAKGAAKPAAKPAPKAKKK